VGGVGLLGVHARVFNPAGTGGDVGQQARLFTQMVVREDAILLFGFATEEGAKRQYVWCRLSASDPKLALALLSP
jgi:Holliday junction DNA helicase RuvA